MDEQQYNSHGFTVIRPINPVAYQVRGLIQPTGTARAVAHMGAVAIDDLGAIAPIRGGYTNVVLVSLTSGDTYYAVAKKGDAR